MRGRTAKREVGEKGMGGMLVGRGREVGDRRVESGRGEICKMGEN